MTEMEFISVWDEYRPKMERFITREFFNREMVEDLVQEVFIRFWNSKADVNDCEDYLYRIAKNVIYDQLRYSGKIQRYKTHTRGDTVTLESRDEVPAHKKVSLPLCELLQHLSEEKRRAFLLKDVRGLEDREVAEVEGIKLSAAKWRISRARDELKELLDAA